MTVERLRGRAGVAQRRRRLAAEPLCRECNSRGQISAATEVDHIVPLALGGSDDDSNVQCLCTACHRIKSATEDTAHQAASNHPAWLRPSAIPITIVCGPPCAGKTTYVQQRAAPDDIVVDLDGILTRLRPAYRHWTGSLDGDLLNAAIRVRNAMLGALSSQRHRRAWYIVSSPTEAERRWWSAKLGGDVVLLHPGVDECRRRAVQRGTPRAIAGIDRWEAAARQPWRPPSEGRRERARIGPDGWPVDGRPGGG